MLIALFYTLWAKQKNKKETNKKKIKNRKEWISALWICEGVGIVAALILKTNRLIGYTV